MEYTLNHLPSDIIYIIHPQLNSLTQINLSMVSKNFKKYPITNLIDGVPDILKLKMNIVKLYPHIIKLSISKQYHTNWKRTLDANILPNLQILYV